MSPAKRHTSSERKARRSLFLRLTLGRAPQVTDDQVAYFRQYPDEIDELSAPLTIHIAYLVIGVVTGVICVVLSKIISFSGILDDASDMMRELVVDLTFEIGVALVGAGITALVLGILLNAQQQNAEAWRSEIRKRIAAEDG